MRILMKKIFITWQDVEGMCQEILRQIQKDKWRPDYVVGITRGGVVPANLISQYLECPMETLKVSLRNNGGCETNCWMAEDAFGYVGSAGRIDDSITDRALRKNILIIDDINDTGATLNWIKQDWSTSCLPSHSAWDDIWGDNVRVATLYDNESSNSNLDINYSAITINKAADDSWIVFPWENWWAK